MRLLTLRDPGNGVDAKFFTREVMDGKDKKPGWVQMTMAKFPVVRQLLSLVANVPSSAGTPMHAGKAKLVEALGSPLLFSETFHAAATGDLDGDVLDGKTSEGTAGWSASGADIAAFIEGMPK